MKRITTICLPVIFTLLSATSVMGYPGNGLPNDCNAQWALYNWEWRPYGKAYDIHAKEAYELWSGSNSVKVCVNDTEVMATHPDLSEKVEPGANLHSELGHGTMIVYYKSYTENDSFLINGGLWAIRPDGTNNRPYLVQGQNQVFGYISSPKWSTDGNWLVFHTGWETNIYKVKANGDSLTKLTFDGGNTYPQWSPDGQKIAFTGMYPSGGSSYGIYYMKDDGNGLTFIKELYFAPVWLDSINTLAIKAIPTHNKVFTKINTITLDTTHVTTITNCVAIVDVDVNWFAAKIVLTMKLNDNMLNQVWSMNIDGSDLRKLTGLSDPSIEGGAYPSWSPDGSRIVYSRYGRGGDNNGKLWLMNADGSNKQQLTL